MNDRRMIPQRAGEKKTVIAVIGVIAASFVYLLSVSWFKWGDLIIDTSRECLVPYRVLRGEVLYKDIFYLFGLFPPHFVSFLYWIFGVNFAVLAWLGIVLTAAMSVIIYKLCRFFLDEITTGAIVAVFLFVFAFAFYMNSPIFNFIVPYSFASTLWMVFTGGALYFFLLFISREQKNYLFVWSGLFSLACFCRAEMSLPVWGAFFLCGILAKAVHRRVAILPIVLTLLSPLLIVTAGYLLFLWKQGAWAGFKESVIDSLVFEIFKNESTKRRAGVTTIGANSLQMVISLATQVAVVGILAAAHNVCARGSSKKGKSPAQAIIPLGAGAAAIALFYFFPKLKQSVFFTQYCCAPLIIIPGIAVLAVFFFRQPSRRKEVLACLTLFLVALATSVRSLLDMGPYGYGFYLIVLVLICYGVFFLKLVPDFFQKILPSPGGFLRYSVIAVYAVSALPCWEMSREAYRHKSLSVSSPRGTMLCWSTMRTARFWEAVEYLKTNAGPGDTASAFPEGSNINFFSGVPAGLKYNDVLPLTLQRIPEEEIIRQLLQKKVTYIVIIDRRTDEYGFPCFGVDYGRKIFSWVRANYALLKVIGPQPFSTAEFGVAIYKRKGASHR